MTVVNNGHLVHPGSEQQSEAITNLSELWKRQLLIRLVSRYSEMPLSGRVSEMNREVSDCQSSEVKINSLTPARWITVVAQL